MYYREKSKNKISLTSFRKLHHSDEMRAEAGVLGERRSVTNTPDMYVHQVASLLLPGLVTMDGAIRIENI